MTPQHCLSPGHDPSRGVYGDCRRAALASILDLPAAEVPHFFDGGPDPDDAQRAERAWLASRGLALVTIPVAGDLGVILTNIGNVNDGAYYLLSGTSANGLGHTVVGCGSRIVHNPSAATIVAPMPDGMFRVDYLTPFATQPDSARLKADALPAPYIDRSPLERHNNVALLFSGGKDSLALVYLLRDDWHRLTVYHLDTGDLLPETRDAVAHVEAMVPRFQRINTNARAWIAANGLPSELVPEACGSIGRGFDHGHAGRVSIVGQWRCCDANRWQPMLNRLQADGVTLSIRGARIADPGFGLVRRAPGATIGECIKRVGNIENWFPIQRWSDDDVLAYLRGVGAPVGRFYDYKAQGIECATCPAGWGEGRASYLRQHHPELAARYAADLDTIAREMRPSLDRLNGELRALFPPA